MVLYQDPGVNAMNPNAIICAVIVFQVLLIFCIWVTFSTQVITPREVFVRACMVAAAAAAIYTAIAASHHRRLR